MRFEPKNYLIVVIAKIQYSTLTYVIVKVSVSREYLYVGQRGRSTRISSTFNKKNLDLAELFVFVFGVIIRLVSVRAAKLEILAC